MWQKLAWIACAGAAGALARYGLQGAVQRAFGAGFPWGTLAVNLLGCLLFGIFWAIAEQRLTLSAEIRIIVLIGFLGAFTTFSTFAFETGKLIEDSEWLLAGLNLLAQNGLGLVCVVLGLRIGQTL